MQNGNSTGGAVNGSQGTNITSGGVQNGNSFGGSASTAYGTGVTNGGIQNGNSTAGSISGAHGTQLSSGGIQNGDSFGGSVSGAHGTSTGGSGLHYGNATGGSVSGSHGTSIGQATAIALITTATGTTAGAFGVSGTASGRYTAIIQNEVGAYAKSLNAQAETTSANVPFVSFVGGGSTLPLIGPGGLVY